ncbi:CHAP domain-containing protein [Crocinitomicaceae bacterium]|nr:CHAP domain-containing protein [Crocinitomicaceae bacterium]
MRLLLLLVFIITTYSSNAQGSYNYYFDWEIRNLNENQISDNLKGVVREVKATYISKKPKRTFQINKTINADGLVTNVKRVNNEGDVVSNIEADYNAKGNVTKYLNTGKNGKVRVQKFNTHDDQFRLTETKQLNEKGRTTIDGYNIGLKYQCVEFVKRYYYEHRMPNSYGHAKSFFDPMVSDGKTNTARGLRQFTNPSISKPQVGDLIVIDGSRFGHVAIVSEVADDEIEIIQQNPGKRGNSRERIDLEHRPNNNWYIDKSRIVGWLRK